MNKREFNSTEHFIDKSTDMPADLYRMLSFPVMENFTVSERDLDPLDQLHDIHIKINGTDCKTDKTIEKLNSRRYQLINSFDQGFQNQNSDGHVYSQTPGELCESLIQLNLWIDDTVLIQNDATVSEGIRKECIGRVEKALEERRNLQKSLENMLKDFDNGNAVFPDSLKLKAYDGPDTVKHSHSNTSPETSAETPAYTLGTEKKPNKTGKNFKHILALACTGHGASITYFGHDGTIRSSVFDRWAGTKYTFLMAKEEIATLLERRTPLAAEMHDLLELSYGRFPRHRAFENDFSDWLAWLLKDLDVTPEDIDLFISSDCLFVTSEYSLADELDKWFPNAEIYLDIEHHTIHQRQAFWQSGFDKAAIVTLDTCGEDLIRLDRHKISGTISQMDKSGNCKVLREFIFPQSSAGLIYSVANHHIGYAQGQEGKTMGLAPYGSPELYERLLKSLRLYPDGSFDFLSNQQFHKVLGEYEYKRPGKRDAELTKKHENIAFAAQSLVEDIITNAFKAALRLSGLKNIVFAGGVALNSVANEIAFKAAQPEDIYICPNPSDGGQALGFALYAAYEIAGWKPSGMEVPEYLGPTYTPDEVRKAVETTKYNKVQPDDPDGIIAKCIANGHIVARCSGGAEFGPRALGNRSIIADPRRNDMKDYLNSRVKHREGFRPFAPSVLIEHVSDWFDLDDRSPYMLRVVQVPDDIKDSIPAIVHVDGTARVQTVDKNEAPGYWKLINKFYKITNVPVVLNTSFNVSGKPIVETPQDAVDCYESTNIDLLLLEDWVLSKRPLEEYVEVSR